MKTRLICLIVLTFLAAEFSSAAQDFIDATFNPGTGVNGFVESVLVQPDGKILICGSFTAYNGVPRSYMARLNSNGSLDESFNAHPNYWVRSMALQPDGKIVLGGFFTALDGLSRNRVGRVNADGTVDTTFNPGAGCEGRIVPADPTSPFLFAVALQADGKIIIGGNFTNYNRVTRSGVARLNTDGSLDNSFNVGSGVDSWVRSIMVAPNQQIYFSGWFQNYNSRGHDRMVRVNPDGSADESFKTDIGYSTAIYSIALQPDGKIIVGGHSVNTNSPFQQEVVRLNTDGSYDLSFNPGGEGSNEKVEKVILQPDGKILIGGYFSLYNGMRVKSVARLNSDGTLDTDFVASANNWVWDIALQNDDKFLIAGAFSDVNGAPRNGIARLNFTKDPPPPPIDEPPQATEPTNSFVVWHLDGTNLIDSAEIPDHPALDPTWQLVAFGDINGDGSGDAVYQNEKGQIAAWFVTDSTFSKFKMLRKRVKLWRVIAINDGLKKHRAELLLQRPDGRLSLMRFGKGKFRGAGTLNRKTKADPSLRFIGFSDFDQNNRTDWLWQDNAGQLVVWSMRGTRRLRVVSLNSTQPLGPEWNAIALGDVNGDEQKDILFRNESGNVAAWLMNGTNVLSTGGLAGGQPVNANWSLVGVNDMNGDQQNDFIWRTK